MSENPVTRDELKAELATFEVRVVERLNAKQTAVVERLEKMETTLVNEFRKWGMSSSARLGSVEVTNTGLAQRMALMEERMNQLEKRL